MERSFQTDQDRLIKELRLAKVRTLRAANEFLEKEYWPEWNAKFARSLAGMSDLHQPLTPATNLAASLSHVETRVIGPGLTFAFSGAHYRIVREDAQAGMKGQPVRVELRLDGTLHARYQGRYIGVRICDKRAEDACIAKSKPVRQPRKGTNTRGPEPMDARFLGAACAAHLAGHSRV